ncbi:MAG: hypothetical protein ACOYM3_02795 [Terrimicrobiaceae bacterium]
MHFLSKSHAAGLNAPHVEDDLLLELLEQDRELSKALIFLVKTLRAAKWQRERATGFAIRSIRLGYIVPREIWKIWAEYLSGLSLAEGCDIARWELQQKEGGCFFLIERAPGYMVWTGNSKTEVQEADAVVRWVRPRRWEQRLLACISERHLRKACRRILRFFKRRYWPKIRRH